MEYEVQGTGEEAVKRGHSSSTVVAVGFSGSGSGCGCGNWALQTYSTRVVYRSSSFDNSYKRHREDLLDL